MKWGDPPALRVIGSKPSEGEEGEEKRKVKIEVSAGVIKTFPEFDGGKPRTSSSSSGATRRSSRT